MRGHELDARRIVQAGAAIAVAVLLAVASAFVMLHAARIAPDADRVRGTRNAPAGAAALQSAPQLDLARYRAEKARRLESSGWVDRERGIAHIPIEQAMRRLVERGARPSDAAASGPPGGPP